MATSLSGPAPTDCRPQHNELYKAMSAAVCRACGGYWTEHAPGGNCWTHWNTNRKARKTNVKDQPA